MVFSVVLFFFMLPDNSIIQVSGPSYLFLYIWGTSSHHPDLLITLFHREATWLHTYCFCNYLIETNVESNPSLLEAPSRSFSYWSVDYTAVEFMTHDWGGQKINQERVFLLIPQTSNLMWLQSVHVESFWNNLDQSIIQSCSLICSFIFSFTPNLPISTDVEVFWSQANWL